MTLAAEMLLPGSRMQRKCACMCIASEAQITGWAGHRWGDKPSGPGPARCQACSVRGGQDLSMPTAPPWFARGFGSSEPLENVNLFVNLLGDLKCHFQ